MLTSMVCGFTASVGEFGDEYGDRNPSSWPWLPRTRLAVQRSGGARSRAAGPLLITTSATVRLITQPVPFKSATASWVSPKVACPNPSVNTWVPAPSPIAQARNNHARWRLMSRRRTAIQKVMLRRTRVALPITATGASERFRA